MADLGTSDRSGVDVVGIPKGPTFSFDKDQLTQITALGAALAQGIVVTVNAVSSAMQVFSEMGDNVGRLADELKRYNDTVTTDDPSKTDWGGICDHCQESIEDHSNTGVCMTSDPQGNLYTRSPLTVFRSRG